MNTTEHRRYNLIRIVLPYAVCGLLVDAQDVVREAAPIMRWAVGKPLAVVTRWVAGKRGTVERLPRT